MSYMFLKEKDHLSGQKGREGKVVVVGGVGTC